MRKLLLFLMFPILFACSSDSDINVDNNNNSDNEVTNPTLPVETIDECVLDSSFVISSQEELDAFAALHPCYVRSLFIGVNEGASNITSLEGLTTLKEMSMGLSIINNPLLTSLKGLDNLEKTGEGIFITNNQSLLNLKGLTSLKQAGEAGKNIIHIFNNKAMQDFTGIFGMKDLYILETAHNGITSFKGLENVAVETLTSGFNRSLTSLDGLQNQRSMKELYISNSTSLSSLVHLSNLENISRLNISNSAITNLHGLEKIKTIKVIALSGNSKLTSLEGVEKITEFVTFTLHDNTALTSIVSLNGLTSIKTDTEIVTSGLRITKCAALQSLNGLENLKQFEGDLLIISDNVMLKDFCAITTLLNNGNFANDPDISQNAYNPGADNIKNGNCKPN